MWLLVPFNVRQKTEEGPGTPGRGSCTGTADFLSEPRLHVDRGNTVHGSVSQRPVLDGTGLNDYLLVRVRGEKIGHWGVTGRVSTTPIFTHGMSSRLLGVRLVVDIGTSLFLIDPVSLKENLYTCFRRILYISLLPFPRRIPSQPRPPEPPDIHPPNLWNYFVSVGYSLSPLVFSIRLFTPPHLSFFITVETLLID